MTNMNEVKSTPLPPFPKPDIWSHVVTVWRDGVECQIDQGPRFTSDQMQAYATQARADLEAENQRLREALGAMQRHVEELCTVYGVPLPQATFDKARAALEGKP